MPTREFMTPSQDTTGAPKIDEKRGLISYRGWRFSYDAQRTPAGYFRPVVQRLCDQPDGPDAAVPAALPDDTEEIAYATQNEALRHAQQQVIRWVHDRTGTGQGQF